MEELADIITVVNKAFFPGCQKLVLSIVVGKASRFCGQKAYRVMVSTTRSPRAKPGNAKYSKPDVRAAYR